MSNYTAPEKKSEKLRDVNFQNETESAKNQKAETPFDIITQNANIKFFKSQNAEYYINIDARDFGICGNPIIKSNAFDVMISLLLNKITENIWEEKEINKIKRNCSALATINAEFFGLDNRLGFKNNRIFYDLCNKKHEVISISDNEISTIKKYDTTIMFAINENAKEQISPNLQSGKNKYLELLKRHFKLKNEDDLLLLAIYIIACFIPHIPHPVLNLYGTQGSSKSTTARNIKSIIDPAHSAAISLPNKRRDLIATLSDTYVTIFDNISEFSTATSDMLCQTVNNDNALNRTLYTGNDKNIIQLRSCVILTSINIAPKNADLLDRSILIELDRLNGKERKTEESIKADFNRDLPEIIGSIFQILSEILSYDFDKLPDFELPRMADFAKYGYVIGEILEANGGKRFLEIYGNNINVAEHEILMENPICDIIKRFVRENPEWIGTMTQLYRD